MPKYFFSKGTVRTPTIINVVVKADKTMYGTPLDNKAPHKGKATNPGINVIEPKIDAKNIPKTLPPWLSPSRRATNWSFTKNKATDTRQTMRRIGGVTFTNLLNPTLMPLYVFSRSHMKDTKRANAVRPYKKYTFYTPAILFLSTTKMWICGST
jgi:hypothetical protein